MSVTEEQEQHMKEKYEHMKDEGGSPLDLLRAYVMSRGVCGIRTLGVVFRRLDQNGDKKLDFYEFRDALTDYGIDVDQATEKECFDEMDLDGTGKVNFDEFLVALRPPLSEERMEMIDQAFDKFDVDNDGLVTVDDIRQNYSAAYHPKFISGEWTEDEVFAHWLTQFGGSDDGIVTKDDFINYYIGVSSSIDDDEYFVEMMKSAWKL